jgi:hypothetical protein
MKTLLSGRILSRDDARNYNLFSAAKSLIRQVFRYEDHEPAETGCLGQNMHRIQTRLAALQTAEADANKLGNRNEAVIASTVAEVLGKAAMMDVSTAWDVLNEVLESACREACNPAIRNSARQRGLLKAIGELQEIRPALADTRFTCGDLADITPVALKSPA